MTLLQCGPADSAGRDRWVRSADLDGAQHVTGVTRGADPEVGPAAGAAVLLCDVRAALLAVLGGHQLSVRRGAEG